MIHFKHHRILSTVAALLVVVGMVLLIKSISNNNNVELITATAETGSVRQLVSVSGTANAEQSAQLAFPVSGTVREVRAREGDVVAAGDVLIELDTRALQADRLNAVAALNRAIADRDELIAGPTQTSREVTSATVALKQDALESTVETENKKVENAYRALLSTGLEALADDSNEDAVPPTVSGTYICEDDGEYTLTIYSSGTDSGYSYNYAGLESGTGAVTTVQPSPLGSCGLYLQFDANSTYNRSEWTISVPNSKASSYIANLNTYNLAVTQADNAIAAAEQDLALAEASATNTNAPARAESLTRANAAVTQAQAQLERIDATIADRVLRAPFAGTVTALDILPGETVTTTPVVTLLAEDAFDVRARIPEIDIGKLELNQKVEMVFDARTEEIVTGEISFISLEAVEIDGVAYYEALIQFDEIPSWIRSGLNADIDIVVTEVTDVLRLPKRFVSTTDGTATVVQRTNNKNASTTVTIVLNGDDGWVAITGLNEGDVVIAP